MNSSVVIFDDEERKSRDWESALRPLLGKQVRRCPIEDLRRDLGVLEQRRADCRHDEGPAALSGTVFDDALVLVVDYDLFELDDKQVLSGEDVAYLARCFSNCGLILGVNQDVTDRVFDLTMLDRPLAYTDVSIGAEHLVNRGLWGHGEEDFHPWQWPNLLEAAAQFERCVSLVAGATGSVFELLRIDERRGRLLPRDVRAYVHESGGEPDERVASVERLLEKTTLGLRMKDTLPEASRARVIAARLRKWLEYVLLVRQDQLVDAPHLLRRMPGLVEDKDDWQRICQRRSLDDVRAFDHPALAAHAFEWEPWLSRPAWWWPDVASDSALDELRDRTDPWPEAVFCEDTGAFHDRDECRPFVSRLGGSFAQRWVRMPRDSKRRLVADYEPAVALAR